MTLALAPRSVRCLRCERYVAGRLRRGLCPGCANAFYEQRSEGQSVADWLGREPTPTCDSVSLAPFAPSVGASVFGPDAVDDERRAEAWHSFYFELLSDQDPPTTLEELVGPRPAWMASAACRGMGTSLFFPAPGDDIEPARAICARCDVCQECLDYIMEAESGAPGVWGGTTGKDRRRLRKASA